MRGAVEEIVCACGIVIRAGRPFRLRDAIEEVERACIKVALETTRGDFAKAAVLLGIHRKTFNTLLRDYEDLALPYTEATDPLNSQEQIEMPDKFSTEFTDEVGRTPAQAPAKLDAHAIAARYTKAPAPAPKVSPAREPKPVQPASRYSEFPNTPIVPQRPARRLACADDFAQVFGASG